MARGYMIDTRGLSNVLRNIEKYDKKIADGIDNQLTISAKNVGNKARQLAPRGKNGEIENSIKVNTNQRFSKSIEVSAPHAPFVEFGTGRRVFRTQRYQFDVREKAYAKQFYVSGKGTTPSTPYLFPAFRDEIVKLKDNIKKEIFGEFD